MTVLKANTAQWLKNRAMTGIFDGTSRTQKYIDYCRGVHAPSGTRLVFTRDTGYHSGGWFKNPHYDRCYHLSLSFFDVETKEPTDRDNALTDEWLDLFFGDSKKLIWAEPASYEQGKKLAVWARRLRADASVRKARFTIVYLCTPTGVRHCCPQAKFIVRKIHLLVGKAGVNSKRCLHVQRN